MVQETLTEEFLEVSEGKKGSQWGGRLRKSSEFDFNIIITYSLNEVTHRLHLFIYKQILKKGTSELHGFGVREREWWSLISIILAVIHKKDIIHLL